jgi:hypothetical protein
MYKHVTLKGGRYLIKIIPQQNMKLMLILKISNNKATDDIISNDKSSNDKMLIDTMSNDNIPIDDMLYDSVSNDKMVIYEMPNYSKSKCQLSKC